MATAIAALASVGTASAATPTSPAGTTYEGKLHATSEGHVTIHANNTKLECASTLEGEVEGSGFVKPISISLTSLTFTGCTNGWHATVVSPGSLEVHALPGSNSGTVTWTGATIEATRLGITCRYNTQDTDVGTLTASKATGATATIDLDAELLFHSGSSLCTEEEGEPTPLTGSYSVGTPDYFDVDAVFGSTPTSPTGTTYEGKLHATSEGHVTIDNSIAKLECASTLEGEVEGSGFVKPISIPLTSLTFTGCTNGWHATVVSPGSLEVHAIPGSSDGTVTWTGATIEATRLGVTCRYKTQDTDVGTLTASKATGATATVDLSGALSLHSGSSGLCGSTSHGLTGSYSVGTPDYFDVDAVFGSTPTSPAGTTYEGKLHATSEGHVTIDNPIAKLECASTLEGEVEASGFGGPISIPLASLTFIGCTNGWHVTVVSPGSLEVHAIPGSNSGTVTWTGGTIQATRLGVTCNYKTEATDIGTLTASKATGATATIDLSGQLLPHSGSSSWCGPEGTMPSITGSYKTGTPDYLDVDAEL